MNKIISLLALFAPIIGVAHASVEENLNFSGDIRAKYSAYNYKTGNYSLSDDYSKVEIRGKMDYEEDKIFAKAEVKLEVANKKDNEKTSLSIERAMFGYFFDEDLFAFVGRIAFDDVFKSKIQYGSKFNGISLNGACENIPFTKKVTLKGGPFFVSQGEDNFGLLSEVNLVSSSLPLEMSYSLTWWNHQTTTYQLVEKFLISQVAASYSLSNIIADHDMEFFTGFLSNHGCSHSNKGWYVGSKLGQRKPILPNQWNVSFTYQNVEPNSIPQHDLNGAGKNISSKGFVLESVYVLNDNLSFKIKAENSKSTKLTGFNTITMKGLELTAICKF